MGKISADEFLLQCGIATFFGVVVHTREGPIPGVHGDGSDAIAARHEEGFSIAPGLQIPADIQIGMAKVAKFCLWSASRRRVTVSPRTTDSSNSLRPAVFSEVCP